MLAFWNRGEIFEGKYPCPFLSASVDLQPKTTLLIVNQMLNLFHNLLVGEKDNPI